MGSLFSSLWNSTAAGTTTSHPSQVTIGGINYKIQGLLGEGGYAFVYKATEANTGQTVALKRFVTSSETVAAAAAASRGGRVTLATSDDNGVGGSSSAKKVLVEVEMHKSLSPHPNIVKFLGSELIAADKPGKAPEIWVAMELSGESLQSEVNKRIQSQSPLNLATEVCPILSDVIHALHHMHSRPTPVSHWDIKLDNILRGRDAHYKLCDFGSCSTVFYLGRNGKEISLEELELDEKMTLLYRPPESLDHWEKRKVDTKADIWSLGVVLYVLMFRKMPFEENKQDVIKGIVSIPPPPANLSPDSVEAKLRGMLQLMLARDPADRPNIHQVSALLGGFYPAHTIVPPIPDECVQQPRFA